MSASPPRQVFLESTYSYRTPMFLGLGLLFSTAGSYVLFLAIRQILQGGFVWQWSLGIVVGPIWTACMVFSGVWAVRLFVFAPTLQTRLDETGLTMGNEHWSWREIGWIGGRLSKSINNRGVCFWYQIRSKWPFGMMRTVIMKAISSDEYDRPSAYWRSSSRRIILMLPWDEGSLGAKHASADDVFARIQ